MYSKCILLLSGLSIVLGEDLVKRHVRERTELLQKEADMMLGGDLILNEKEVLANKMIMRLKDSILDEGFANPHFFNFSKHFFSYKEEVKNTELYKIMKAMPKGALLHGHDTAMLKPEYLLNITYWDNLYVCFGSEGPHFLFSKKQPPSACENEWQLMQDARQSSCNIQDFDAKIRNYFTIVVDNPNEQYTDVNTIWNKFVKYFITTFSLLAYKPAWEHYYYETLKALREENVLYLELRSVLPELYDLDGNVYKSIDTMASYKKVTDAFVKDYPDFLGAKIIYAPHRRVSSTTIHEYIEIAREIKHSYPDVFAGFDLVGQEDLGTPAINFIPELIKATNEFDFFFHAGETNWYGTTSDENIADAILLGTKRLGHAYALTKHPVLLSEVKKRDIAIEVNVISNAVLCLVNDVRNHPLAVYLSQNVPLVISSDDPGPWEADLITHDFLVAFVGVASKKSDLRLLKKLALNSIKYSAMTNKDLAYKDFENRWSRFIDNLLKGTHLEL